MSIVTDHCLNCWEALDACSCEDKPTPLWVLLEDDVQEVAKHDFDVQLTRDQIQDVSRSLQCALGEIKNGFLHDAIEAALAT